MKVFIDTSAFIALLIEQEEFHKRVFDLFTLYERQKTTLLTSNYILDELLTWIGSHQNKFTATKVIDYLKKIENNNRLKIIYVDKTIAQKAEKVFLKFFEHELSFTDATTYVLYNELSLDEIVTLDSDFTKINVHTSFRHSN